MRRVPGSVTLCIIASCIAGCTTSTTWFDPDWDSRIDAGPPNLPEVQATPVPPVFSNPPESPAGSDPIPASLSIEQAALLALTRNPELRVAQFTPEINGAFELIERGRFAPELFADAQLAREVALETARSTQDQFSVRSTIDTQDLGVRQTLPTGTDVEIDLSRDRADSNRAPEQQTVRAGLTITQSLLRGLGPAVNLASVRVAELETQASRYELRAFIETLLAETETAYWEHLLAIERIAIVERSLEVARQQTQQADEQIEVGVLAPADAAPIRSELALREQDLIDAEALRADTQLRLLRLLGIPLDAIAESSIELVTRPTTDAPDDSSEEDSLQLAESMRPDLNEARLRLEQGRLETIRTRNGLLPRLDVFIALGKTGFADNFSEAFANLEGSTYDYAVGFSFSQPLGETEARGRQQAAIATRRQAAEAVGNLSELAKLDVLIAINEIRRAERQIEASATTRRLQQETADAEIARLEAGAGTALLVAQAQRDLLEAEINEIEAVVDLRVALVRLYLAEGTLLERRGITLAETPPDLRRGLPALELPR